MSKKNFENKKFESMREYSAQNNRLEDIQRASNMANICLEDELNRETIQTRISGVNHIDKLKKLKKRVK